MLTKKQNIKKQKIALGKKIKNFRIKIKLTQKDLGNIFGCKPNTISMIETGKNQPSALMLKKLIDMGMKL